MKEHRVRLTDEDVELIVAALDARTAALTGYRKLRTKWLARRLAEMARGNPRLKLGRKGERTLERDGMAEFPRYVGTDGREHGEF